MGFCPNQRLGASPRLRGEQTQPTEEQSILHLQRGQRWVAHETHNRGLDATTGPWLIRFTKKPLFCTKT